MLQFKTFFKNDFRCLKFKNRFRLLSLKLNPVLPGLETCPIFILYMVWKWLIKVSCLVNFIVTHEINILSLYKLCNSFECAYCLVSLRFIVKFRKLNNFDQSIRKQNYFLSWNFYFPIKIYCFHLFPFLTKNWIL